MQLYARGGKQPRICCLSGEGRDGIAAGNRKPRSRESLANRRRAVRAAMQRPEVRAKIGAAIKAKWRDPAYRENNLNSRNRGHRGPLNRLTSSVSSQEAARQRGEGVTA